MNITEKKMLRVKLHRKIKDRCYWYSDMGGQEFVVYDYGVDSIMFYIDEGRTKGIYKANCSVIRVLEEPEFHLEAQRVRKYMEIDFVLRRDEYFTAKIEFEALPLVTIFDRNGIIKPVAEFYLNASKTHLDSVNYDKHFTDYGRKNLIIFLVNEINKE